MAAAWRADISPISQSFCGISGLEADLGCPAPHTQVANPARAVLQVRLEHEYRVTETRMAAVLLRAQTRYEAIRRGLGHAGLVARQETFG